ncbi:hypothetical protein D8I35_08020 [Corticibacter populi]|uniref:UPF0225 protein D8I35_08020 n=2 Tax=Corticibacter populi TaxID=1550736 RepID=A0A3M6QTV3_9BURK|nr:YchJ family metal-binding protein [Corticibacter populi]RMX06465.1 hypothetical protein D8I35_08020 [Corticibacter populi]
MPAPEAPCPCGQQSSGRKPHALAFGACCGRFLLPAAQAIRAVPVAPDAQKLMRSRYTAYVLELGDYLLRTWHPDTRPANLDLGEPVRWLGLEVRRHQVIDATHAEVEFVARYRQQGRAVRMHERSRFVLEAGQWLYVDGDFL